MKNFETIKTWEDICAGLAMDPVKSVAWAEALEPEDKAFQLSTFRLSKLSKLFWGKSKPDFKDPKQRKWFPIFNERSGFGFVCSDAIYDGTNAGVGARFVYPEEKISDYAAKQFQDWYKDVMILPDEKEG